MLAAAAVGLLAGIVILVMTLIGALGHANLKAQARQLDGNKRYKEETNLLEKYLNSNPPEQYQEDVSAQLGDVAYRSGDYPAAYRWDLRAWTLEGTKQKLATDVNVAQAAALSGDNATAISFYRQAIALVRPATDGQNVMQTNEYRDQIIYLGGHE
jgi:tetratricopeptide (TPR) repeat protein